MISRFLEPLLIIVCIIWLEYCKGKCAILWSREESFWDIECCQSILKSTQQRSPPLKSYPPPTNVKGIRSFLKHTRFYRRFIKDFSKIVKSLCNLLEKDVAFVFDENCLKAFKLTKEKLVSAPIVIIPDWLEPFEIMCDASDYAVKAVLGQRRDKIFRAIYYSS